MLFVNRELLLMIPLKAVSAFLGFHHVLPACPELHVLFALPINDTFLGLTHCQFVCLPNNELLGCRFTVVIFHRTRTYRKQSRELELASSRSFSVHATGKRAREYYFLLCIIVRTGLCLSERQLVQAQAGSNRGRWVVLRG